MKFKINAGEFVRALSATHNVATKNIAKGADTENMVTIKAGKDKITAVAWGGSASAISEISDAHGGLSYKNEEPGEVTFNTTVMKESLLVFKESDVNIVLDSNQLVISLDSDKDFSQYIPTYDDMVSPPSVATDFSKEISVNREVLIDGMKRVNFAVGFEDNQQQYLCLVIQTSKDNVRFIAGSGGEFAITDIRGDKVVGGGKNEIIFPKWNLTNITSILGESAATNVKIKYAEKDDDKGISEQIVLQFENTSLCIFKIDSNIKAPKVDKVLNFNYPNKVDNDLAEWKRSVAGIAAASGGDKETDTIYNAEVKLDNKKRCLHIETKGGLKSKSKVNFKDDSSDITDTDPWFKCNSKYIKDISLRSTVDSGNITLNFENQEPPKGVTSGSHLIKPVLVNYPDCPNPARDTVESFKLFFIASTL